MTRNKVFELKPFLYAADNYSFSDSWIPKDEPLYNLLNQKLQPYAIFHEDLSMDVISGNNLFVPNQLGTVISFAFLQVPLDYPTM